MAVNYLFIIILSVILDQAIAQNVNTTVIPTNATRVTIASTNFITTPSLTVDEIVVGILEDATGNQMELSNNVYTWNVTLLIKLINETNPDYLTDSNTMAVVLEVLPDYVIRQFPLWLLLYHGLCAYINETTAAYQDCLQLNLTQPAIDFCVGPFVHTTRDQPSVQNQEIEGEKLLSNCGLSCAAGSHIWGLTESDQKLVDIIKIVGCSICIILLIFLAINQYIDSRSHVQHFRDRPLLQDLPYFITLSLFMMVFTLTIPEIVGKETILCRDDSTSEYPDQDLVFSGDNPIYGGDITCSTFGIIFYLSTIGYAAYTTLLSFVIFRSLYRPMNPLWNISKKWWHLIVFLFVSSYGVFTITNSKYHAMWPMGICFPHTQTYEDSVVPMIICITISSIFLCGSTYLLRRELIKQRTITTKEATYSMNDLLKRLIIYSFTVILGLIGLLLTADEFDIESSRISDNWIDILFCQFFEALANPEWTYDISECQFQSDLRTERFEVFYFISWTLIVVFGVFAQTILSCHEGVRNRLMRVTSVPLSIVTLSTKRSNSNIASRTRTLSKKSSNDGEDTKTVTATVTIPPPLPLQTKISTYTGNNGIQLTRVASTSLGPSSDEDIDIDDDFKLE